jgi:hypothetical protein
MEMNNAGVRHGTWITEDSTAIEIFSPVRQDYIPKDNIP